MSQLKMSPKKAQSGAAMIEYALIAALIAVVAITALTTIGTKVNGTFAKISTSFGNV